MPRASARSYVKERCTQLRAALLDGRAITKEELAPYWPGGAENPDRSVIGWIYCYGQLARFSARAEARQEFTHGAHEGRSAELIALLGNTPRRVRLLVPVVMSDAPDGSFVEEVVIGYRSWTALRAIAVFARLATRLAEQIAVLEAHPEHTELVLESHQWHERVLQILVWAATHNVTDGRLPWSPRDTTWPDPPLWLERVSVIDRLSIQRAFAELHGRALMVLAPYLTPDESPDPLGGWHTFFASYSAEHDIAVESLIDARPFAPFFAQLSLAAHSARQQTKDGGPDASPAGS